MKSCSPLRGTGSLPPILDIVWWRGESCKCISVFVCVDATEMGRSCTGLGLRRTCESLGQNLPGTRMLISASETGTFSIQSRPDRVSQMAQTEDSETDRHHLCTSMLTFFVAWNFVALALHTTDKSTKNLVPFAGVVC